MLPVFLVLDLPREAARRPTWTFFMLALSFERERLGLIHSDRRFMPLYEREMPERRPADLDRWRDLLDFEWMLFARLALVGCM
jgi:hypothetical protein